MNNQDQQKLSSELINFKQKQFTGQINIQANTNTTWRIYLCLGRLVWADGGVHSHRSWKRLINKYCPQINWHDFRVETINKCDGGDHYVLIAVLEKKLIDRESVVELVKIRATEVLFDLLQLEDQHPLTITSEVASTSSFLTSGLQISISLVNIEQVLHDARQTWVSWQQRGLGDFSPNLAPMMRKQDQLQEEVSGIVYQNFLRLLDGESTLRDLSSRMGKDLRKLTSSLIPYVKQGLLDLLEVQDISPLQCSTGSSLGRETVDLSKPLIACIDDSPQICKVMEQIVTKCGYRYMSIQESLQALPSLIKANPDFIFLDIGMPIVNGYEICTQVRRVSKFKNTPIAILTGNDGIIDRMRAKVCGANAFVAKPIEIDKIVSTIEKYMSTSNITKSNVSTPAVSKI